MGYVHTTNTIKENEFQMSNNAHEGVNTLTFDLFGTVLDLAGSLMPHIDDFLAKRDSPLDARASGRSGDCVSALSSIRTPS